MAVPEGVTVTDFCCSGETPFQELTDLGVQWHFTEVTVATEEAGEGDFMTEEEEAKQADLYAGLMRACIDLGPETCITFQTWGISDR